MAVVIRDANERDEDFILALNASCVPAVSELTVEDYREIKAAAHRVLVAEVAGVRAGFVILIHPGAPYPSDNYAWFSDRFSRFLYVDRIAIEAVARGAGVGQALYTEALKIAAANGDERVTAEVNVEPPNPSSMKFHEAFGFRHLLSRPSRDEKMVAMLEKVLPEAAPWEGRASDAAWRFGQTCRRLADENPYPEIDGLSHVVGKFATELWDECFSQTEIRKAFEEALENLPGYAGEERRPNSKYK